MPSTVICCKKARAYASKARVSPNPTMAHGILPGAHWSGVYYVSQPAVEKGESGKIEFLNPRTDLPNWRILKSPIFGAARKFRPHPGELVLFPSYLVHWVYPNETQEERVSIAFNATFREAK